MNLNLRESLLTRLRKGKQRRSQFVESHLAKGIAYQIRATRERLGWSQEDLAGETKMPQNAISRLESPDYGKPTITTLKRLATAMDVGLVVRFVPFSELVDWVSGTPRVSTGLSSSSLAVPSFDEEDRSGAFADLSFAQSTVGLNYTSVGSTATVNAPGANFGQLLDPIPAPVQTALTTSDIPDKMPVQTATVYQLIARRQI